MPGAAVSVTVGPHGQFARAQEEVAWFLKITPNFSFAKGTTQRCRGRYALLYVCV